MAKKMNWKPSNKTVHQFGWTVFIGFGVIGGLVFSKGHHPLAFEMWAAATAVLVLSLLAPVLARPIYWIWMGLGMAIGFVMSKIVLMVIFFVVLTPVAFVFRWMKRDPLKIKKSDGPSYWEKHPEISDAKYYEHMF